MSNNTIKLEGAELETYIAEHFTKKERAIVETVRRTVEEAMRDRQASDGECNGWSNYATWRVNLELIGDLEPDYFGKSGTLRDLADAMKQYVEEMLDNNGATGLVRDYADAFIAQVDWYEIARNFTSDLDGDDDGDIK